MRKRWLLIVTGSILLACFIAGIIAAERTAGDLFALWRIPAGDPAYLTSYWNYFLQEHFTVWLAKFAGVLLLLFGLPGIGLLKLAFSMGKYMMIGGDSTNE